MSVIELRTFVGTKVKYKGYTLVVAEVNKSTARLMEPTTGSTAVIPALDLRKLLIAQKSFA